MKKRTRRLGVAEAKSKLSEVLREAAQGPTIIHSRGRDLVVVLTIEDYERLTVDQQPPRAGGAVFLQRVEALKHRHGGGVGDFEPARLDFEPAEPFAIANSHGMGVATRDVDHFRGFGVPVYDPFNDIQIL